MLLLICLNCSSEEKVDTLHILHINSLYGRIFPTTEKVRKNESIYYGGANLISQAINKVKKISGQSPILIGNSNMFYDSPIGYFTRGEAVVNVMNKLEFDCIVLGERDFLFKKQELVNLNKLSNFPFLCSNLVNADGLTPNYFKPYIIIEKAGFKIGVIGIASENILKFMHDEKLKGLKVTPIDEAVKKYSNVLKKKSVDFVIVAGDLNYSFPIEESANNNYKDSNKEIISAISPEKVDIYLFKSYGDILSDNNLITKCNGIVSLRNNNDKLKTIFVVPEKGYVLSDTYYVRDKNEFKHTLEIINSDNFKPDIDFSTFLNTCYKTFDQKSNAVLGYSKTAIRYENAMYNLVTDAIKYYANTNIAFIDGDSVIGGLKKGEITRLSLYNQYPSDDILYRISITGDDLLSMLRFCSANASYFLTKNLQVSGLSFKYNLSNNYEDRLLKNSVLVNHTPVKVNNIYSIAITQRLLDKLNTYRKLQKINIKPEKKFPDTVRNIIEKYVQKLHVIKPTLENRIINLRPECIEVKP
jgi:2',3'-cyclic-nucleotide 2'-phosphodiesterase (5'-nucleotidase family)